MKPPVFILTFLITITTVGAQDTARISGQEAIESILTNSTDEQDLRTLVEELEYLQHHPIYIPKPNYNDLVKLPFVSPMLAEAIVLFTDSVQITSIRQLLDVSLMTEDLYGKLIPFVTLDHPASQSFSSVFVIQKMESRTRLERRLQLQEGYRLGTFRGDVNSVYQRIRLETENIELAGLLEKDAGELYDDGLIAGYLSIKNIAFNGHVVVGNFTIASGQGLIFAKNIATTKGSNAVGQARKRGSLISPSVTTDEYRYFQGVAGNAVLKNFSITGFYSERNLPASVDSSGIVTSFYSSGVYRTSNDRKRKNGAGERVIGSQIGFAPDPLKTFSVTLMNVEYDKTIGSSIFDLRGRKSISAGSVSWEAPLASIHFFGEIASNEGKRYSKIVGAVIPLSARVAISYHHRSFTQGFVSPFARPFGERDIVSDGELGNYIGAEIRLPNLTLNTYVDRYLFPPTTSAFGMNGRDLFAHALYSVTRKVGITLQVRNKLRSQSLIFGLNDQRAQTNYRLSYKSQVTGQFSFSQRVEVVNVSYRPTGYREKGFLTFFECMFKQKNTGINVKTRIAFFDTDSYDSRLYQYESDVAGNFSNPPLYGNGIRWYMIVGYEMFDRTRFSLKYSETKKLHERVLGTGDDEIVGNLDNYIAVQLDFTM